MPSIKKDFPEYYDSSQIKTDWSPSSYSLRAGISLWNPTPRYVHHYLRAGYHRFTEGGDAYGGGYGASLAPLYPLMEWKPTGFRFGELDVELGFTHTTYYSFAVWNLYPYAIGTFDLLSYAFRYGVPEEVCRFSLGGSMLAQPGYWAPALSAGVNLQW